MRKRSLILMQFILILFFAHSAVASKARWVICQGPVQAKSFDRKTMDNGNALVKFALMDSLNIKNISVQTQFKKIRPQSMEAADAKAIRRAVASGSYRADLFNIGDNGACQMAIGYQGELANSKTLKSSWGILGMSCGNYSVLNNLKCQMR